MSFLNFLCLTSAVLIIASAQTTTKKGTRIPPPPTGRFPYPQLSAASYRAMHSMSKAPAASHGGGLFGGMFGGGMGMQRLLPLIMGGEGEGMTILLLAQMIDDKKDNYYLKILMLSGRLGKVNSFSESSFI